MKETLEYQVAPSEEGERLDRFLAERAPDLTRARVKSLIDRGLARVDGREPKPGQRLKNGQRVVLTVPETTPPTLAPDPAVAFGILYQDEDIIVVDKPAGLVVHPAAGHREGTLVHGLLAACPDLTGVGGEARPGIVHRLDKDTSGVMIVAKNDQAHRTLVETFKNRAARKEYLALCTGARPASAGEIDLPIGRHPVRRKEMSTRSTAGREALTRFEVLWWAPARAGLLRVRIFTGRTHQIRVHLAALGCPVLGDGVYGKGAGPLKNDPAMKRMVTRQMLHAHRLEIPHPRDGRSMQFVAPVPGDMGRLMAALNPVAGGADDFRVPS